MTVYAYFKCNDRESYFKNRMLVEAYITAHGLKEAYVLSDYTIGTSECFDAILADAEEGRFRSILILNKAALGSSAVEIENNYYALVSNGIRVNLMSREQPICFEQHCLNAVKVYNTGGIEWLIKMGAVKAPLPKQVNENNLPFGYRSADGFPQSDDNAHELVELMFEMYASGESTGRIADELKRRCSDKNFTRTAVTAAISNPRYIGIEKGVAGAIPALVSNKLWLKAGTVCSKRRTSKTDEHDFLLVQTDLTAKFHNPDGMGSAFERVRLCAGYVRNGSARINAAYFVDSERNRRYIEASVLENEVLAAVMRWIKTDVGKKRDTIIGFAREKAIELRSYIKSLDEQFNKCEQNIKEVCVLALSDPTGRHMFAFDAHKHKYLTLKVSKARAELDLMLCEQSEESINEFFDRLCSLDKLSTPEQRFMLSFFLKKVRFRAGGAVIVLRSDTNVEIPIPVKLKPCGGICIKRYHCISEMGIKILK